MPHDEQHENRIARSRLRSITISIMVVEALLVWNGIVPMWWLPKLMLDCLQIVMVIVAFTSPTWFTYLIAKMK